MALPRPGPVPREALDYFDKKEVKPSFSYTDVWKQEHATAFAVAKVTELKVLESVRTSVRDALVNGTTFAEWKKQVKPELDKSGWSNYSKSSKHEAYRLRTIFDSNMRTARAAGQWNRIERTKKALPYLQYTLGPSVKHRDEHVAWEGLILPVDDPFWDYGMPPSGHGCKCGVIQVSRGEAEEKGISETPEPDLQEWTNKKTGDVELVPRGVQPGWNYNPGKNRVAGALFQHNQEKAYSKFEASEKSIGKPGTASYRFRELILAGGKSDKEIFAIVQNEFNLDAKKSSYVAWYRNELSKKGFILPGEKPVEKPVEKPHKVKPVMIGGEAKPAAAQLKEVAKKIPDVEKSAKVSAKAGVDKVLAKVLKSKYVGDAKRFSRETLAREIVNFTSADKGDGLRQAVRDMLASDGIHHLERFTSVNGRDVSHRMSFKRLASSTLFGYYHPKDGSITISELRREPLRTSARALRAGGISKQSEYVGLNVVLHEVLHGCSPRTTAIYSSKAGKLFEEVTTEVATITLTAKLLGTGGISAGTVPTKKSLGVVGYDTWVFKTKDLVAKFFEVDDAWKTLQTASVNMKRLNDIHTSTPGFLAEFVAGTETPLGDRLKAKMDVAAKEFDASNKLSETATPFTVAQYSQKRAHARYTAVKEDADLQRFISEAMTLANKVIKD